jgi:thioredoxin-like negative regulator of GroEL
MLDILYFSAPWCGPCRAMKPAIDKFEETLDTSKAKLKRVNVDEDADLVSLYNIHAVPTFIFVKDSNKVESFTGVIAINKLQDTVEKWS